MKDPVRVKLENGSTTTVERAYAERRKLPIVTDAGAVDSAGRPLPDSGRVDDLSVARADARHAARQSVERSQTAKKAAAKRTAAQRPASTGKRAAAKTTASKPGAASTSSGKSAGAGEGNQS